MTLLNKLVEIEKSYGMVGTMLGIMIIAIVCTMSVLFVVAILHLNFQIIDWVFRNLLGFKLF